MAVVKDEPMPEANPALASAMAGKAARACDVCGVDRSRWYCAADEAYLCSRCDNSVHCVNALASRHERFRLGPNGAPCKATGTRSSSKKHASGLHSKKQSKGGSKHGNQSKSKLRGVKDEDMHVQPAYVSHFEDTRVPSFTESLSQEHSLQYGGSHGHVPELQWSTEEVYAESSPSVGYVTLDTLDHLESSGDGVIGGGSEDEYIDFTDIVTEADFLDGNGDVEFKKEFGQDEQNGGSSEFCHLGLVSLGEVVPSQVKVENDATDNCNCTGELLGERKLPPLKLNYDDILSAWSDRPLWTDDDGQPQTVPNLANIEIARNLDVERCYREHIAEVPVCGMVDDTTDVGRGREARVMRYREKRRNRLFSKQIRYEVRKLNAERRPRMKGRFVKRVPP